MEDLTRALELLPLDRGIHTNRAIVLNSLKRYEEAIEDLDVAAVYGSHNARVVFQRGKLLYRHLKDPAAAVADLERTVEISPEHLNGWYYLGRALFDSGECRARDALITFIEMCQASESCDKTFVGHTEERLPFLTDNTDCNY